MSDKKAPKTNIPNIGKNTRWDSPEKSPKAGQIITKPSTSLDPKDNNPKK